ncbi:MAG: V-type ATPase subunit [Candidatus Micrarchaeota archaeon]|nr:V-type ATPase subunit [Candidatus Micrarchaeota archaeon]
MEKKQGGYGNMLGAIAAKLAFRPLTYGYSNARVRAMRPHLLSRRQAEDMLKVKTNAAVAEYLSRTGYRDDFTGMGAKVTDEERVEIAVSKNFARTAQKLLRITPKASQSALFAFLGRYDILNIKTILLAKKLGKHKQETEHLLIPAGSLSMQELEEMISAKSADELYDAIHRSAFGGKFLASDSIKHIPKAELKALLQKPEEGKLDMLLSALDSYYYEVAASAVSGGEKDLSIILDLIRSEADAKNVITAMRLKKSGADKHTIIKSMVTGGNFTEQQIGKMASAKGVPEIATLASSFFISATGKGEFAAAEAQFKKDGSLSHFEVVFEHSLARRSLHALRRSMMSLGAIIGFLFLKEEEMNNIRKIVRGKALGLPMERTAEMLVLVG